MAVEVHDCDGPVGFVHAAQQGQSNGVVAAHGDDTGECPAVFGLASHFGVGGGCAHQDAVVALLDLLDRPLIIVARPESIQPNSV